VFGSGSAPLNTFRSGISIGIAPTPTNFVCLFLGLGDDDAQRAPELGEENRNE
jgi:hypothetical protein